MSGSTQLLMSGGDLIWKQRGISAAWSGVCSSSDGNKLAACINGGYIYTSTDSGANWTQQTGSGSRSWKCIACSSDGVKLVACDGGGYIYTSTDSGVNWTQRTGSGTRAWLDVACSSDGIYIYAVVGASDVNIYKSADSGATWGTITGNDTPYAGNYRVDCSSDGSIIVASPPPFSVGSYMIRLTNWGSSSGSMDKQGEYVVDLVGSSNGTKYYFISNSYTYYSSDSGATFNIFTIGAEQGSLICCPSSGSFAYATLKSGSFNYIHKLTSGKAIKYSSAGNRSWSGIACSSNGSKVVAVVNGGFIYTGS